MYRLIRGGGIGGPTCCNGSMVPIDLPNDEIGIGTSPNTDDFYLLAIKRMMWMGYCDPFRTSLG
jgi:hypothetical protein